MADSDYVHAVGFGQALLGGIANILNLENSTAPRALCGETQVVPDDAPEPGRDAPRCPVCAEKGGFRGSR